MESIQKQNKIIISVSDPESRKQYGGAKQYYVYYIRGEDQKGKFQVLRRYSDFDYIRWVLVRRWPGCYIPSLPSKVKIQNSDQQFLQSRSKYLERFLYEISKKSYLWNSDQMQIFLRNTTGDCAKCLSVFTTIDLKQLVYRLGLHFDKLQIPQEPDYDKKISDFGSYLGILFTKIQQLRNKAQQLNSTQTRFQKKYSKFLVYVLSSYEDKFVNYYSGNVNFKGIFNSQQNLTRQKQFEQSLKQVPFKILFQQIRREKRQISAFQQSFKMRDEYLKQKFKCQAKIKQHQIKIQQLNNGKKSFFSKLRNVSTDQQISNNQKSIQKYKDQLDMLNRINQIITKILGSQEIIEFKTERTNAYYKMVQQVALQQLKIIQKQRDFWISVTQNNHYKFQIEQKEERKIRKELLKQQINNQKLKKSSMVRLGQGKQPSQQTTQANIAKKDKKDKIQTTQQIQNKKQQNQSQNTKNNKQDKQQLKTQKQAKQVKQVKQAKQVKQKTNEQKIESKKQQKIQSKTENQQITKKQQNNTTIDKQQNKKVQNIQQKNTEKPQYSNTQDNEQTQQIPNPQSRIQIKVAQDFEDIQEQQIDKSFQIQ